MAAALFCTAVLCCRVVVLCCVLCYLVVAFHSQEVRIMNIAFTVIIAILSFAGTRLYRAASSPVQFLAFVCLFIQVYLVSLVFAGERGSKKYIPIIVAVVAWLIAFLVFPNQNSIPFLKDFFGFLWQAVKWVITIVLSVLILKWFTGRGNSESGSQDVSDNDSQESFGEWMPDQLIDDDNNYWVKDYAGSNQARYHCNSTGKSVTLYEGNTQYYGGSTLQGSDGKTYHWN